MRNLMRTDQLNRVLIVESVFCKRNCGQFMIKVLFVWFSAHGPRCTVAGCGESSRYLAI